MQYYVISALIGLILAVYPVSAAQTPGMPKFSEIQAKTARVWVTAYASVPEQTDDTPFVTAHNTRVRDGIVASNTFPFGTLIKIPKYFGDKVFVVDDRMNSRKKNFVDVWMPTKAEAKKFGIAYTDILILEPSKPAAKVALNEKTTTVEE